MSLQGPQHVVVAVKFSFAFLFISFGAVLHRHMYTGIFMAPLLHML